MPSTGSAWSGNHTPRLRPAETSSSTAWLPLVSASPRLPSEGLGASLGSAAPGRAEALAPQVLPRVAGVQTALLSFALRFALLEPFGVWIGRHNAPGEHLRIV